MIGRPISGGILCRWTLSNDVRYFNVYDAVNLLADWPSTGRLIIARYLFNLGWPQLAMSFIHNVGPMNDAVIQSFQYLRRPFIVFGMNRAAWAASWVWADKSNLSGLREPESRLCVLALSGQSLVDGPWLAHIYSMCSIAVTLSIVL